MARIGFVYDSAYLDHEMGTGHPESPQRLRAIVGHLERTGLLQQLVPLAPAPASDEWITQAHDPAYVQRLKASAPRQGRVSLDPDTAMSPGTLTAAYLAAGGALTAVSAVMEGRVERAFCAVRPPGHHAERNRAMGFCFFNNVAVAARYLRGRYGLERVLIVDWDVHHGNGTQDIFYDDPTVLFFSTHQYPHYPGTGRAEERGVDRGRGLTINVPLPPGQGDREYQEIFERELTPEVDRFKPEFVLISAGFDAHGEDPLASMSLTEEGYGTLTRHVVSLARRHCHGRLVSCLEGGYNLQALAASVEQHLLALMET